MTHVMGWAFLAACVVAFSGCDITHVACKTNTPDVHIDAECLSACNVELPIIFDADSIVNAAVQERIELKKCELKRQLCVNVIKRAQDAGAIK
jgi:hypothetical protein